MLVLLTINLPFAKQTPGKLTEKPKEMDLMNNVIGPVQMGQAMELIGALPCHFLYCWIEVMCFHSINVIAIVLNTINNGYPS